MYNAPAPAAVDHRARYFSSLLEDMRAEDISSDQPLFERLGLDSIDALELGLVLKKRYGLSVSAYSEQDAGKHFASVQSIAAFVAANRKF
jgi:acyl carrier protein